MECRYKTDKLTERKVKEIKKGEKDYLYDSGVDPLRIPLIISWCVIRNSEPGYKSVAMTAFWEWVWITAPLSGRQKPN